jgi:hypothetical protein
MSEDQIPTIRSLDDLASLLEQDDVLYIRWSRGPAVDAGTTSRDELTGIELPGLCANPLQMEAWWGDRSWRMWVARRLYDYRHLQEQRGEGVRPWVLKGREVGRGPDNEPIVDEVEPVAWVADEVVAEATTEVESLREEWGPLRRS